MRSLLGHTRIYPLMNVPIDRLSRLNPEVHLLVLLAFFWVFISVFMPHEGHPLDMPTWADWIIYMQQHGLRHVYELHTRPAPGQPPGFIYGPVYMYLLYIYGKWPGSVEGIRETIYQFKSVILIFDVLGIWFALRYVRDKVSLPFYALLLLFNVGLLYDTVGWAQADSVITCLMFMAMYYALRKNLTISGLCIIVALLIKPQPIVFLPAFFLIWLPVMLNSSVRRLLLTGMAILAGGIFLLMPFLLAGTAIDYWTMLSHSAQLHTVVSVRAANIWPLLLTEDPYAISDTVVRFGLSYRQWGLLMFAIGYVVVLFPLAQQTYQIITRKRARYDTALVLLTFGLLPVVFYFFNTQMHERYAHPSVLFLAAYALYTGRFVLYIVVSIANFWVMETELWLLKLYRVYQLVTLEQVAVLFLLVLVWGTLKLYRTSARISAETISA